LLYLSYPILNLYENLTYMKDAHKELLKEIQVLAGPCQQESLFFRLPAENKPGRGKKRMVLLRPGQMDG
ncbi:MAG: hypothetical protein LUG98_04895, partial [Tannerellaceae bacterium]|nr:hypothetical protein [Tannerellaceae bacterium]